MLVLLEDGTLVSEDSMRHEIHFPVPENASRLGAIRHNITTRNVLAFLLS